MKPKHHNFPIHLTPLERAVLQSPDEVSDVPNPKFSTLEKLLAGQLATMSWFFKIAFITFFGLDKSK